MFHRPLISLSFFFLSFFLSSFFLCTSSSNRFLFFDFSRCQSTNKIVMHFLSFSGGILIFPYELTRGRQFTPCTTDTSVCYGISWLTDLSDFSFLQIQPSTASYHVGFLANRIQPLNRSLVAGSCLPVHTTILGKLDCQLVSTRP